MSGSSSTSNSNAASTAPVPVQVSSTNDLAQAFKDTPLAKLNYFDGRYLRAEDMTREQRYHETRSELVAMAQGAGPVWGLGLAEPDVAGAALTLSPGLGFTHRGEMVYLNRPVTFDLPRLIEATEKLEAKATGGSAGGSATFGDCMPAAAPAATAALATSATQPVYVITIAPSDALCGRLDVYGSLCEAACIQGSAANLVLAGAVLRARPVDLTLPPVNGATDKHLRSLLATAWFRREAAERGALLSAGGLQRPGWCGTADEAFGHEIPLGIVLMRNGGWIVMDQWTVRRERMTPLPLGHWQGRMGMRRHEVFLAEVLQFQCQLSAILRGAGLPALPPAPEVGLDCAALIAKLDLTDDQRKALAELMAEMPRAAAAAPGVGMGWLFDNGIAELPPAGFLPVDPSSPVALRQQIARELGPEVDFRLLAAPADVIPHAFEEARDMRRIPLVTDLRQGGEGRPQLEVYVPDAVKKGGAAVEDYRATHAGLHNLFYLGLGVLMGTDLETLVKLGLLDLLDRKDIGLPSWIHLATSDKSADLALLGGAGQLTERGRGEGLEGHIAHLRGSRGAVGGLTSMAGVTLENGPAMLRKAAEAWIGQGGAPALVHGMKVQVSDEGAAGMVGLSFQWDLAIEGRINRFTYLSRGRLTLALKEAGSVALGGSFNGAQAQAFEGAGEIRSDFDCDNGADKIKGTLRRRVVPVSMWTVEDPVLKAGSIYLLAPLWDRTELPLAKERDLPMQLGLALLRTRDGYVPQYVELFREDGFEAEAFIQHMRKSLEAPNGLADTFDRSVAGPRFDGIVDRLSGLNEKLGNGIKDAFRVLKPGGETLVPTRDWVMFRRSRAVTEITEPLVKPEPKPIEVEVPPKEPEEPVVREDRVWKLGGQRMSAAIYEKIQGAAGGKSLEDVARLILDTDLLGDLRSDGSGVIFSEVTLSQATSATIAQAVRTRPWVPAGDQTLYPRLVSFAASGLLSDSHALAFLERVMESVKRHLVALGLPEPATGIVEADAEELRPDDAIIVLVPALIG